MATADGGDSVVSRGTGLGALGAGRDERAEGAGTRPGRGDGRGSVLDEVCGAGDGRGG